MKADARCPINLSLTERDTRLQVCQILTRPEWVVKVFSHNKYFTIRKSLSANQHNPQEHTSQFYRFTKAGMCWKVEVGTIQVIS